MRIEFEDIETCYQLLLEFWNKLNIPEKAIFRNIMAHSSATRFWDGQEEQYYIELIAIERFKDIIKSADLGKKPNSSLLSRSSVYACKGLLDKGLSWKEDWYFKIEWLTLDFWEPGKKVNQLIM